MYGQINPGTPPPFDGTPQDSDDEMRDVEPEGQADVEPEHATNGTIFEENDASDHDLLNDLKEDRIVIAIDFGTTFSSVAYVIIPKGVPPDQVDLRHVRCIGNYPSYQPLPGVLDFRNDVPTELWYDDGSLDDPIQNSNDSNTAQVLDDDEAESSSSDDDVWENELCQFEEDDGLGTGRGTQNAHIHPTPVTRYWGYEVQQRLNISNFHSDDARPLTRFKLNLDPNKDTEELCTDIRVTLKTLMKKNIIEKGTDIYSHYLTHLLDHTKQQLLDSNKLSDDMLVQFVLCVPAKWPMRGCRTMQLALEKAVVDVGMGERASRGVLDMFIVSEPEAAAECILAEAGSEILVITKQVALLIIANDQW
jgi:hypothetical protein